MWRWHAGEETEHKGVPYDIYLAVGGFYLERIWIMLLTTFVFQTYSYWHLMVFLWNDRCLFSAASWREVSEALGDRTERATFRRQWLAYFRPGYHPAQLDTRAALGNFRRELADSPFMTERAPSAASSAASAAREDLRYEREHVQVTYLD